MRLIDADALIDFIDCGHLRNPLESCFSERDVVDMLESRPTIDAVPVVRCMDCDYYRAQLIVNTTPTTYVCCRTNGYSPGENHYCAWAKKSALPKEQRYTAGCLAYYGDGIKVGKKEETT